MVSPNIWAKPSEQAFDINVPLPIKYSANLKSTYFSNAWAEEKSGAALDALNVLYVAFTRPKEELIVFAKAKKARKKISDVSDLLYAAVSNDFTSEHENQKFINPATYYNSENQIFELKTNYLEKDSKKYLKDEIGSGITINSYPSFDITERLKISSDSDDFRIESVDYLKEKVDYGSLMHLILSKIKHLEDADSVLDNLYFAGYLSEIQKQELAQNVREILSRPVVKNWFSQDSEVFNEREIISKSGTLRIPDRVVIQNNEIVVIDFKFGEIRKEHEIQIKEYMQLLFEIYQKRPKGILYYAEKNKITEVRIDEQLNLFES
jgi:ATP-dependent exoDNAse (exonuclease V) beta subunit